MRFEAQKLSSRKWSFSVSVSSLSRLLKPAHVVSSEQGTGVCDFRRSTDVWPLGSGWASAKLKRHGSTYMVAVLSDSPRTLQIIVGSCQHFWPEIRSLVREESIRRIFILSHLVLNKAKHYWMESWCVVHPGVYEIVLISQFVLQRQPNFVLAYLRGCTFIHLSVSLRVCAPRRLTSPLWPTLMKVHIGWNAPVPQARRWVRLWGCRRRTKLAHSVCKTQMHGHSLKPWFSKKYRKRCTVVGARNNFLHIPNCCTDLLAKN